MTTPRRLGRSLYFCDVPSRFNLNLCLIPVNKKIKQISQKFMAEARKCLQLIPNKSSLPKVESLRLKIIT